MLRSFLYRFSAHRSILPVRDIFDAELDRARRQPGCALCRLVQEHDQKCMQSFLWEHINDGPIGAKIDKSWGFCPFHAWTLEEVEDKERGDRFGMALVYQGLLTQLRSHLLEQQRNTNALTHMLPLGPEIGSRDCMFCLQAQKAEAWFLSRLVMRFQRLSSGNYQEEWASLHTELCLPHMRHLLQACSEEFIHTMPLSHRLLLHIRPNGRLTISHQQKMQVLATIWPLYLAQHISELDANIQEATYEWNTIARHLAFLIGDREALPATVTNNAGQKISRQQFLVTGEYSELSSPSRNACPLCLATANSIALCIPAFEEQEAPPSVATLCQSHHWLLAASIFFQESTHATDRVIRYSFWLKQQLEQQMAFIHAPAQVPPQREQLCSACTAEMEASREATQTFIQGLQAPSDRTTSNVALLCLFHWKQILETCIHEPDTLGMQKKLLSQQQYLLDQLTIKLEAYLARFSATKRTRGEVPNIPGAPWAWKRLLAFFASEPVLEVH